MDIRRSIYKDYCALYNFLEKELLNTSYNYRVFYLIPREILYLIL